MKKGILTLLLVTAFIGAKAIGKVHTWEIKPDTTIIYQYSPSSGLRDTAYDVSCYFQFWISDADKDSFSVSWNTIRINGSIKNSGVQRLPNALLQIVGETIDKDDLNMVLAGFGLVAIKPKEQ